MKAAPTPLKTILRFYSGGQQKVVAAMVLGAIASGAVELCFPFLIEHAIDQATDGKVAAVGTTCGLMLLALAVGALTHGIVVFTESQVLATGSFELRRSLFSRLLRRPFVRGAEGSPDAMAYNTTATVRTLEEHLLRLIAPFAFDMVVALGSLLVMLWRAPILCALLTLLYSVTVYATSRAGDRIPAVKRLETSLLATMAGLIAERLSARKVLRIFGAEPVAEADLAKLNDRLKKADTLAGRLFATSEPLWSLTSLLGIVVVVGYGGTRVAAHEMTVGGLVAFLTILELFVAPVSRMGGYYFDFLAVGSYAGTLASTLAEPASPPSEDAIESGYDIELPDIGLSIPSGSHVAIVGLIGSGKSTLLDRIAGLIPGEVLVGGKPLAAWGRDLAYAPQEATILRATLEENLLLGRDDLSDQVDQKLEEFGLMPFVASLAQGKRSAIGRRSQEMSGGERQLIGLARAFMGNPKVILLDEPTANMDAVSAENTLRAVRRLSQSKTLILVTHTDAALDFVDRVVRVDAGRIVSDVVRIAT